MKRILLICAAVAMCASVWAQTARETIALHPNFCAINHVAYPYSELNLPSLTAAPAGYEPFYIAHYGRHGSRWQSSMRAYEEPLKMLEKAEKAGQLTASGIRLLTILRKAAVDATLRTGELSDIGAEQHQGIARRMGNRFPEVFAGDAVVDAKSSVVIRCILSMTNAVTTLKAAYPHLRITTDASAHDQHFTGGGQGEDTLAHRMRSALDVKSLPLGCSTDRFMAQLFVRPSWAKENKIDAKDLMSRVFTVAGALQNHHAYDDTELFSYFTSAELFHLWRVLNARWYVRYGNAEENGHRGPFTAREHFKEMITTADSIVRSGKHGASLRFGHDTLLLPLACLLELGNANYCGDLETLHEHWRSYELFLMAGNIQLVFYRKAGSDDVLVKALFNEQETTLPVPTDQAPYYHWSDLRDYYLKKAATPIDWN